MILLEIENKVVEDILNVKINEIKYANFRYFH